MDSAHNSETRAKSERKIESGRREKTPQINCAEKRP